MSTLLVTLPVVSLLCAQILLNFSTRVTLASQNELALFPSFQILQYVLSHFSSVRLSATPWTMASQAPLSVGFSRQEYWSGLPLPSPAPKKSRTQISQQQVRLFLSLLIQQHEKPERSEKHKWNHISLGIKILKPENPTLQRQKKKLTQQIKRCIYRRVCSQILALDSACGLNYTVCWLLVESKCFILQDRT